MVLFLLIKLVQIEKEKCVVNLIIRLQSEKRGPDIDIVWPLTVGLRVVVYRSVRISHLELLPYLGGEVAHCGDKENGKPRVKAGHYVLNILHWH